MPTEWMDRESIRQLYGWIDGFESPPAKSPRGLARDRLSAGDVTDDIVVAMSFIDSVAEHRRCDRDVYVDALRRIRDTERLGAKHFPTLGSTTARAVESI